MAQPESVGQSGRSPAAANDVVSAARGAFSQGLHNPPPSSRRPHPLDDWLLALLNRAFSGHAGPDSRIDAGELQRSLEIKNEYLARRVLAAFDRDGDGLVSRDEFLQGVERLVFGSVSDKLEFAFGIHDLDGDKIIERAELLEMIALSMAEENAACSLKDAGRLTDMLIRAADRSGDGRVSYPEFEAVLRRHPDVLNLITRSEAQWIAPNEDLLKRLEPADTPLRRVARYLENHLPLLLLLAAWTGVNVALFGAAVDAYRTRNGWIQLARGCGACLNLNGALIFVPVMRRLLTAARRSSWLQWLPIDDALACHRFLGHAVFAFALVHSFAHCGNYIAVHGSLFGPWLLGRAAFSGILLLLVLLGMWLLAQPKIRASGKFELFYLSHFGYLLFAGLALVHGPHFWIWASVPLAIFAVELAIRSVKRAHPSEIRSAEALRSGVTRLEITRPPGFHYQAGDYVFLRIPAIARFEWHPFTLSSAPEGEHLTVHVRSLGDFTSALRRLAEARYAAADEGSLPVYIDGPYGTASCHIFESRHAVLIGAGIGVTPFASVLESLLWRVQRGDSPLDKAHFFWLNRDPYSFEWFHGLLLKLEQLDRQHKVDIRIYMTGGRGNVTATALNVAREVSYDLGNPDALTGLRSKTHIGSPDWLAELRAIRDQHAPDPVDVFFCGPPGLARKIRSTCSELGLGFRQEHF